MSLETPLFGYPFEPFQPFAFSQPLDPLDSNFLFEFQNKFKDLGLQVKKLFMAEDQKQKVKKRIFPEGQSADPTCQTAGSRSSLIWTTRPPDGGS